MNDIWGMLDGIVKNIFGSAVDRTRDGATYSAASAVERATFGRVFSAIEGGLFLIMLFGCIFISSATQNSTILQYICGILWVIPFIAVGTLLARFRNSLFVRIRGIMNRFLGGR